MSLKRIRLIALLSTLGLATVAHPAHALSYIFRSVCPGLNPATLSVGGEQFASCKAILAAHPSAADGPYQLTLPAGQVITSCDMTNGGWTLVARRNTGSVGTPEFSMPNAVPVNPGYLVDALWANLSAGASELRALPQGNVAQASIISLAKLAGSNYGTAPWCAPLAPSLAQPTLLWYENTGCTQTGMDYTLLGSNNPANLAYIANAATLKYDSTSAGMGTAYSWLTLWVR